MTNSDHQVLQLFTELLAVPAPSGREQRMAALIRQKLDSLSYSHITDGAGNVYVRIEGKDKTAPLCCLAAHMDEIGMVVTRIEEDGTLSVDRSGGLYPWKLGEGPVDVLGDTTTITSVLAMGSTHVVGSGDHAVTWSDVRLLTGLTRIELAQAGVRPGTTAVPASSVRGPVLFGNPADPLVGAWTFDDRMGVVALLRLLEQLRSQKIQPHHPTIIAFTVHEEGGAHGAKILAHREQVDIFISIDGCPMPPGTPLLLDGRPGIWSKDRIVHYDQTLIASLQQSAHAAGTELQTVVYDGAASDASLVYSTGGAYRVACFGHVRENSHGYEVARLSVFNHVIDTLVHFVNTWTG